MTERSIKYLSDILLAIALIKEFAMGITDFNAMKMIVKLKVQLKGNWQ